MKTTDLKQLNDKLYYHSQIKKDKKKNHVVFSVLLASSYTYTGYIQIKINHNLKFGKNLSTVEKASKGKIVDRYFVDIANDLKNIKEIEDLMLCLISIGLYDILKKVDFLSELADKYRLLK